MGISEEEEEEVKEEEEEEEEEEEDTEAFVHVRLCFTLTDCSGGSNRKKYVVFNNLM